ncbi:MAG: ribbon-helix-helix protein, CopG family [Gemmatimonadetes bacterium]|nr:ribbon-helix-helix protein, CopG family [Gemmatimonadota bacterium]
MSTTVTVRLDEPLREALEARAQASGTTISEVVRDTLREALAERPLGERIGHLKGILELEVEVDDDPWRRQIKERNWRP